jgi:hypothetical protein
MTETQVYRICPVVSDGKFYEYAECTRKEGRWPNEKWFTTNKLIYVGRLVKIAQGGYGDGGWRTDYFEDEYGNEHKVDYNYFGTTCFREVPQRPIPSLQDLSRHIVKKHVDVSHLEIDNPLRAIIVSTFEKVEPNS